MGYGERNLAEILSRPGFLKHPAILRFFSKIAKQPGDDGCWLWTGKPGPGKYGLLALGGNVFAHRASYLINVGPIPEGLFILHRCDVRLCVRPSHLFPGTKKDNAIDMVAKGRCSFQHSKHPRPRGLKQWARMYPERVRRGTACTHAKLNDSIIIEIRNRYAAGEPQRLIGQSFGIRQSHVWRIVHGKTWAHVGGPIVKKGENQLCLKLQECPPSSTDSVDTETTLTLRS